MIIKEDDLTHPAVLDLIAEHQRDMYAASPETSVHTLDICELRSDAISFWAAWEDDALLGCGALKELNSRHGEIKSMRTASAHQRKGVAASILEHIIAVARGRGYERLSLETGSGDPFDAALRFYEKHGFQGCEPFADYRPDPFSRFLTLSLER